MRQNRASTHCQPIQRFGVHRAGGAGSVFTIPWLVSYPSSPRMEWRAPASQALTAAYVEATAVSVQQQDRRGPLGGGRTPRFMAVPS